MDWSNDTIFKFLEVYQNEPCIWNAKNCNYKNRCDVNDAWKRISEIMGINIADLKRKKDSLMAQYRALKNKMKNNESFNPSWFAFTTMDSFLCINYDDIDIITMASETTIPNNEDIESLEFVMSSSSEPSPCGSPIIKAEQSLRDNSHNHFSSPDPLVLTVEQKHHQTSEKKAIKREHTDTYEVITNIGQITEDECQLYANLLAIKLRKFCEDDRENLMHDIDNLVYKARCRYKRDSISSSTQILHYKPKSVTKSID